MTIKEIRDILFEKLPEDWRSELRFFVKSDDFCDILQFLHKEVNEYERRFTPPLKQLFTPFTACALSQVKVVFLVPYPWQNPVLNTGLALEVANLELPGIGFFRFKQELLKEYPESACNVKQWSEQGCFMLNTSLTSEILKLNVFHEKAWFPFTLNIINILNKKDVIWVIVGESQFEKKINKEHVIINVDALPEVREQKWESNNLWGKINEQLKLKNKSEIIW